MAQGHQDSRSQAAAAIEAAAFTQQFDAVGWALKEYNPDENHQPVGRSKLVERLQFKRMVQLHNLGFGGTKHLVITTMLLRASTLMEIHVFIMMPIKGFGTHMTSKLTSTSFCFHR